MAKKSETKPTIVKTIANIPAKYNNVKPTEKTNSFNAVSLNS